MCHNFYFLFEIDMSQQASCDMTRAPRVALEINNSRKYTNIACIVCCAYIFQQRNKKKYVYTYLKYDTYLHEIVRGEKGCFFIFCRKEENSSSDTYLQTLHFVDEYAITFATHSIL